MPDPGGPYVGAALFCEKLLAEQDGVVSAVRIIDRVFFVTGEDGRPLQPQSPLTLLVTMKSGAARGSYSLEVRQEKPSGEELSVVTAPVLLEGEDRGANLVLNLIFEPDQAGLYWFDVYFEGELKTRVPLRAVYQAMPTGPSGS